MKSRIMFFVVAMGIIGIDAFAVKLPDGKNVRSDEIATYDSGALKSVKLREDTEITTSIGSIVADRRAMVHYYENGNVKSLGLQKTSKEYIPEKILNIESNLGTIEIWSSSGDYELSYISFYQSGAIWFVTDAIAQITTPKGTSYELGAHERREDDVTFGTSTVEMLFYDSGTPERAVLWKACGGRYRNAPENLENFRYGLDGFRYSFYKNGEIEKVYRSNYECETSLGTLFCGNDMPLMFWENGSLKQCSLDDALVADIYGQKVSIPVGGLVRFRKDGSVEAYTTKQKIQYIIGSRTYTSNEDIEVNSHKWNKFKINFDTVVFDDKGKICQLLKVFRSKDDSLCQVSAFYDSGAVKKIKTQDKKRSDAHVFITENGTGYTEVLTPYTYRSGITSLQIQPEKRRTTSLKGIHSDINSGERIYMLYFSSDGYPSSYSVVKTIYDIENPFDKAGNVFSEYKLPNIYCLLELTEESEFVIASNRIKDFEIIQD